MRHPAGRPWTGAEMCERITWAWAKAFGHGHALLVHKNGAVQVFSQNAIYTHATTGEVMSAWEFIQMAERTLGRGQDLAMLFSWVRTRLKIGSSLEDTCRQRGWESKTVRRRSKRSCERLADAFTQLSPALVEKHLTVSKSLLETSVASGTTPTLLIPASGKTPTTGDQEGK